MPNSTVTLLGNPLTVCIVPIVFLFASSQTVFGQGDTNAEASAKLDALLVECDRLSQNKQTAKAIETAWLATELAPKSKKAWYALVNCSTFVARKAASPESAIKACDKLLELGEKPYFAKGFSHFRLNDTNEALKALILSRNEFRRPGLCQDPTLAESDVKLLYFMLTECFIRIGADDLAIELVRERSGDEATMTLGYRTISFLDEGEKYKSCLILANYLRSLIDANSNEAKNLWIRSAIWQAMDGQLEACEESIASAKAIESAEDGLNLQCKNLPKLLAAQRNEYAKAGKLLTTVSEQTLQEKIDALTPASDANREELQNCLLEQIRRCRSSDSNERAKNELALTLADQALQRFPKSQPLAIAKLELLLSLERFDEMTTLLVRNDLYRSLPAVWPLILESQKLTLTSDDQNEEQSELRLKQAVEKARQAILLEPDNKQARVALIEALSSAGQVSELMDVVKHGLGVQCWHSAATLGDYFEFMERHVDALALNSMGQSMPMANVPMFAWKRGVVLEKLQMTDFALQQYQFAFDHGFSSRGARMPAIELYMGLERFEEAVQLCNEELGLRFGDEPSYVEDPSLAILYLRRAKCYRNLGDELKANADLEALQQMKGLPEEIEKQIAELQ